MSTISISGGEFYGSPNISGTQNQCKYTYKFEHKANESDEQKLEVQQTMDDNSKYIVKGGKFTGATQIGDNNTNHTHIHIHTNNPKTITEAMQSLSKSNTSTDTAYTYQIETAQNCKKRPHSITPPTSNRKKRKLSHNINDIDGVINYNESSVMNQVHASGKPLTGNKLDTIDINNEWNHYNDNNTQKKSNCINLNLNNNNNNSMVEQQQKSLLNRSKNNLKRKLGESGVGEIKPPAKRIKISNNNNKNIENDKYEKENVLLKQENKTLKERMDIMQKRLDILECKSARINAMNLNELKIVIESKMKLIIDAEKQLIDTKYKCVACKDNAKNISFDGCCHISICDKCEVLMESKILITSLNVAE